MTLAIPLQASERAVTITVCPGKGISGVVETTIDGGLASAAARSTNTSVTLARPSETTAVTA
jgi:hypothetical protein